MGAKLRASRAYVVWVLALVVGVVGGVVFLGPASSADEPETGTGSISGTITWPRGEQPDPSVRLHRWAEFDGAFRWTEFRDLTVLSADGSYDFQGLPAGRYLVEAEDLRNDLAPAFHGGPRMEKATEIKLAAGGAVSGIGIALEPGGSIAGTLTVPKDAGVVSLNVNIFLRDDDGTGPVWRQVGRTAAETDGRYQARSLRAGTYRLEFVDDVGAVQSEFYDDAATIEEGVDVAVGREAVFNIDASLGAGGTIAGRISAPVAKEALGKLRVTVYEFDRDDSGQWDPVNSGLTDLEGRYEVSGLSAGTYRVGFRDVENGLLLPEFHQDASTVEQGKDVVLGHREVVTVDAVLGVGATLEGTVSSPEGKAVHDLEVSAHRREGSGTTVRWRQVDEPVLTAVGGGYRFSQLAPGTYRVGFEDPTDDFVREFWDDATTLGSARDIVVSSGGAVTGIDAVLSTKASLSGTVTAGGGLSVGGVRVKAYAADGATWRAVATTGVRPSGRWELAGLEAGSYRLEFTDSAGRLRTEFHDDVTTLAAAKDLVLTARGRIAGIATALAAVSTPPPVTPTPPVVPPSPPVPPVVAPTPPAPPAPPVVPPVTPVPVPVPVPPTPSPAPSPTPKPTPKTIKRVKAPKISGKAKVGKTLKVSKGTWKPKSVTVKYQWFTKKGKKLVKVKAGKKAKLKLTKSMRGKRYRVVVTVSKKGYRTVKFTTKWSKKVKK